MEREKVLDILREEGGMNDEVLNTVFVIGQKIFIRAITFHQVGRLTGIYRCGSTIFLKLEEAAWVASSGRFSDAIDKGTLDEVEPVKTPIFVNVQSIVDFYQWDHPLPREQK